MTSKRKLPSLDSTFLDAESRPTDDPILHQGRVRKQPHINGQWACHIYLELLPSELLLSTLQSVISIISKEDLRKQQTIHSLLSSSSSTSTSTKRIVEPLHISLSRPLILQSNQLESLKREIGKVVRDFSGFESRYATFSVLENDELTRRFLGIEIGQGYSEMKGMIDKIDEVLKKLRLETYYDIPRFHTSIAWSILNPSSLPVANDVTDNTGKRRKVDEEEEKTFNVDDLKMLEENFGKKLRAEEIWVEFVCLKIGKDVIRFKLK